MSSQQSIQIPIGKLSIQMCAALRIITAEQKLSDTIFKYIDIQTNSIDWESIDKLDLSSGDRAAMGFVYAVWTDRLKPGHELFKDALSMSPELQRACLKALGIRWGL